MEPFTYSHFKLLRASFKLLALRICRAKASQSHTIGEILVKPAAVEMAREMCGDAVANKLNMVSCSNNTIRPRIEAMSGNILK